VFSRVLASWIVLVRFAAVLVLASVPRTEAEEIGDTLRSIPKVPASAKRLIESRDLLLLRNIDSLNVSPDGAHFAILVRQAIPERNTYRTGWFVGSTAGGGLLFVGDGGEARLITSPDGDAGGEMGGGPGRWSPDGKWLAYTVRKGEAVQLWRSQVDGHLVEQLTRNAADVHDFAWSEDGRALFFTTGAPRAELRAREQAEAWRGYPVNAFQQYGEIINPGHPPRPVEDNPTLWIADLETHEEHRANTDESRSFGRVRAAGFLAGAGGAELPRTLNGAAARPTRSSTGKLAWLSRTSARTSDDDADHPFPLVRVTASLSSDGSHPISCAAKECSGLYLDSVWWSADDKQVLFWNASDDTVDVPALYAWEPSTGKLSVILRPSGDVFGGCAMAVDRLICLRETSVLPMHVVAINTRSGTVTVLADVNPELRNIRFGRIERIEWEMPSLVPGLYPKRNSGYVLYPPNFDPSRKYPVFIAPYSANGFQRGDVGDEHPLFVYAASGIVVLHTSYPVPNPSTLTNADLTRLLYSRERGFPYHTTMLKSTLRALDLLSIRGFVDDRRVGIGGLSQGSGNPLYMLIKEDRIAAASVAGGYYEPDAYYLFTPYGRSGTDKWAPPPPLGEGLQWWYPIDVAQHVDKIKAPILFNIPDQEVFANTTLLRHLEDGHKPFDAYVYPGEYHEKWQPAHRQAIYRRNLDWFRFWLQDYEDPDPAKADQYKRWRDLRKRHDSTEMVVAP
jgi:dipeptidyl aminopeptidase/acylaminoacyl peptidase